MPSAGDGGEDFEDFTAYMAARREDRKRAPGFRLDGETFICEPVLRAGALLDVAVRSNDVGRVPAYIAFLEDQLLPESWERFAPLLRDRDRPVDDELVEKLVEKIVSDYAGRPTPESSSSPTTPAKRGRSGKGGSTRAGSPRSA
jgi:hypothetical protein